MKHNCSIDGCERPVKARGWCGVHYYRWLYKGDPLALKNTEYGLPMKFVEEALVATTDECILWPFSKIRGKRGKLVVNGRIWVVSRYACQRAHGEPPRPELDAAHTCGRGDVGCINPRHLVWKTRAENNEDKITHGTDMRGSAHPMAKLNDSDVVKIKRMLKSGNTQAAVAAKFGVSQSQISEINIGKAWRHIA